jgi:hypothetical protein
MKLTHTVYFARLVGVFCLAVNRLKSNSDLVYTVFPVEY